MSTVSASCSEKESVYRSDGRSVAVGSNGLVTSAHPWASSAGMKILKGGGNAFDAAVATAVALNVVEPYMSGVGGIGLALIYVAKENRVRALNFSGCAPSLAEPSRFTEHTKEHGILSAMIPGNLAGWHTLHETYGSCDWERLFKSAISYADQGIHITEFNRRMMLRNASRISAYPSKNIILDECGAPPLIGHKLRMPELAKSLRNISKQGATTFYQGELAELIVEANQSLGGLYTLEDFAKYHAYWQDPIHISYRGRDIFTTPPNSSGFQVLQTMKTMEGVNKSDLMPSDVSSIHTLMEVLKLCVADRIKYAGDPDFVHIPVEGILSKSYARRQIQRVDQGIAASVSGEHFSKHKNIGAILSGKPEDFDDGMTTHFAVADRDGNVVSITQTLGGGFGSAVAVGETGIFLNNMCNWFDLDEGSPNLIGPGKKVDFVIAPTQTFEHGKFLLSIGTPGSWGILQTTPQMLINILDFDMNIQQAIEAPRFRYYDGLHVDMEKRFPTDLIHGLRKIGHEVRLIDPWSWEVGGAQGIFMDSKSGVFQGGADPRRDGYAVGW